MHQNTDQSLYQLFGVTDLVTNLKTENKKKELSRLEKTLSKFILIKGVEDLSQENRQKLAKTNINDSVDLYVFFNEHIENFPEKLKKYGAEFRNTIITK